MGIKKYNWFYYIISFLLVIFMFCVIFKIRHLAPFGGNALSIYDADIVYLDTFNFLKDVFQGKQSIIYSFTKNLGGNYIGLFHTGLASPFNMLITFFTKEQMPVFFDIVVVLKLSLASTTFFYFIKNVFGKIANGHILILSLCYAFSNYSIQQSSNIIWLDSVYLLPLMLLGVHKAIFNKKILLLTTIVAFNIVVGWYAAYFNCLFAVFYTSFLVILDSDNKDIKRIKDAIINVIFAFIIGVGISMFIFYPTILSLRSGAGQFEKGVFQLIFEGNILNIFQNYIIGGYSTAGSVCLYGGMSSLLLIGFYFINDNIIRKERILTGLFCIFLFMCFYFRPLYGMFCGFKVASSFYYRFSYVVIIFLLIIAAKGLNSDSLKAVFSNKKSIYLVIAFSLIPLIFQLIQQKYDLKYIYGTIIFLVLYYFLFKKNDSKYHSCFLIFVVMIELCINANSIIQRDGIMNINNYSTYMKNEEMLLSNLSKYDGSFYRIISNTNRYQLNSRDLTAHYNEPLAFGYNGISHYTSNFDQLQYDLYENVGYNYPSYPEKFRFMITNTRLISFESLVGVKYIFSEREYMFLKKLAYDKHNNKEIYYNPFFFPIAFKVSGILPALSKADNPFEYQNKMFQQLFAEKELFVPVSHDEIIDPNSVKYRLYNLDAAKVLYGYIDTDKKLVTEISQDNIINQPYSCWCAPRVVMFDSSRPQTDVILHKATKTNITDAQFYQLDLRVLKKCQEIAQKTAIKDITIKNDGFIECNVIAKNDFEKLFLAVPYDKGWSLTINGQSRLIDKFANSLMIIPLHTGNNHIVLQYSIPGVRLGVALSLISIFILTIIMIVKHKISRIIN